MSNITFIIGQGGLGRPLPGDDYISAILFYCADNKLPSGFSTTKRIRQFFSPAQALAAGIKSDYSGATAATSTNLVTGEGVNGETVTVTVPDPSGTITLAIVKQADAVGGADSLAGAIADAINAGTRDHGYSALADGTPEGQLIITAPKRTGIYMNTKLPVFTLSAGATMTISAVAFTGGVADPMAVWAYHINEYFRVQPGGNLFVAFYPVPTTYDFTELVAIQNFAQGKVRQFAVYKDANPLAAANVIALSDVCETLVGLHKETMGVLGADISGTTDLTTLPDLSIQGAQYATVDIGQDGAALGSLLFKTYGKSITTLGATLGAIALAKVNESVAWLKKFNLTNGTELDVPAIANGQIVLAADGLVDEGLLKELENRAYNYIKKYVGDVGTYRNSSRTTISADNDFAFVENVRTMQKAMRNVYLGMLPELNGPVELNPDGTFQEFTIQTYRVAAEKNLVQMRRDSEVSSFRIDIDPTQKILETGEFVVSVAIQPVGVAREIVIPISFTVQTQ